MDSQLSSVPAVLSIYISSFSPKLRLPPGTSAQSRCSESALKKHGRVQQHLGHVHLQYIAFLLSIDNLMIRNLPFGSITVLSTVKYE